MNIIELRQFSSEDLDKLATDENLHEIHRCANDLHRLADAARTACPCAAREYAKAERSARELIADVEDRRALVLQQAAE